MRAFLDACVLFPPLVRGCLLSAAAQDLFDPCWSAGVIDEWAWANARDHGPRAEAEIRDEAASMAARWPHGLTDSGLENQGALDLPDADDRHVLQGALEAKAELLVTFNLRDFPARKLRAHDLAPIHPDALLWELAGRAPAPLATALGQALRPFPRLKADPDETLRALKRAGLPRLAKLIKRGELPLSPEA